MIDIASVETGEKVAHISVAYPTFTLAWVCLVLIYFSYIKNIKNNLFKLFY